MTTTKHITSEPTGQIDTTITETEVLRGDGAARTAAIQYVEREFPGAVVLAAWPTNQRGTRGHFVWRVEWVQGDL